jgi:hypothetical protein
LFFGLLIFQKGLQQGRIFHKHYFFNLRKPLIQPPFIFEHDMIPGQNAPANSLGLGQLHWNLKELHFFKRQFFMDRQYGLESVEDHEFG